MAKGQNAGKPGAFDVMDAIMAFEDGTLNRGDTIDLFQHLVDTGMAWQLQGTYGRTARAMIDAGLVTPAHVGGVA